MQGAGVYVRDRYFRAVHCRPEKRLTRIVPALVDVIMPGLFVVTGPGLEPRVRSARRPVRLGRCPVQRRAGYAAVREPSVRLPCSHCLNAGQGTFDFSQRLALSGSGGIRFATAGETTEIKVRSPWPHPEFSGAGAPASYETSDTGFSAVWSVPSLARSYPNLGTLHTWPRHFTEFAVGVDLYQAGTHYKLVERSVKRGVLFIGLTSLRSLCLKWVLGAAASGTVRHRGAVDGVFLSGPAVVVRASGLSDILPFGIRMHCTDGVVLCRFRPAEL